MNMVCYEQVCYERGLFSNVVRYEHGMLWTWSVMNVVCYERVYYEHGLLWRWSVMNGQWWTWSVMNVVCYERGLLWTGL